jgi:hypothetical protein
MDDQLTITYQPPGPVVARFLASRSFVRGIRGPFGSGKSTACVIAILQHILEQRPDTRGVRRSKWAVVRNTYPELKTTTIATWHEIVPQNVGHWVAQGPPTHTLEGELDDGTSYQAEVMFLALDSPADVKKLLSMNLTAAWVNEAREIPQSVIDGLTGRVGRYPSEADGGSSWSGLLLDTNPPDTDHWWYTLAEGDATTAGKAELVASIARTEEELREKGLLSPDQKLFEFFAQPSGLSPDAENVANLRPGYYIRLQAGKSEDWIKVYVRGEYGFVMDGKPIYPEYSDSMHCASAIIMPLALKVVIGLDFGLTPAATFNQRLPNGRLVTFHEVVSERMGASRFAEALAPEIAKFSRVPEWDIVGDPSGDTPSQTDEQTVFQILRAKDIPARPARTNDFTMRRDAVGNALARLVDGKPGVQISPNCHRLRKALAGGYCMKRVMTSAEKYRDKPDKDMNSHVAESQQYAFIEMGENPKVTLKMNIPTAPIQHRMSNWSPFDRR